MMRKYKRIFHLLLCVSFVFSLLFVSACAELVSSEIPVESPVDAVKYHDDDIEYPIIDDEDYAIDTEHPAIIEELPIIIPAEHPILVLLSESPTNPFAAYIGEILNAEGFQGFITAYINDITQDNIADFDIIILTEMSITFEQRTILVNYVVDGGNLIGMQPDASLYPLFGIIDTGDTNSFSNGGYIRIDTIHSISTGLEEDTLKIHSPADAYIVGGNTMATLYSDSATASEYSAVVTNTVGNGKTAAFSFSLSRSVVFMRQGNPERAGLAGQIINNSPGARQADLMYVDGENSFNNREKIHIQQADEKMRLLSRIIEWMSPTPLPRLWYLPDAVSAVLVVTGDSDGGGFHNINDLFDTVRGYGGRASIYLWGGSPYDRLHTCDKSCVFRTMPNAVNHWSSQGHEVGIHFDNTASLFDGRILDWDTTQAVFENDKQRFFHLFPDAPHPVSVRNHHLTWLSLDSEGNPEFAAQGIMQYNHGLRMDFNPYNNLFEWQGGLGFQNGSGLPMRLVTSDGEILGIFQSDTHLPDEVWRDQLYYAFTTLAEWALLEGKYAWLNTNLHPNLWPQINEQARQMFSFANENDIPIWSGRDQYDFTIMRDGAIFNDFSWYDNTLSFNFIAEEHDNVNAQGLTIMIPFMHNELELYTLTKNGEDIPFTVKTVNGTQFAFAIVGLGNFFVNAEYATYDITQYNG